MPRRDFIFSERRILVTRGDPKKGNHPRDSAYGEREREETNVRETVITKGVKSL